MSRNPQPRRYQGQVRRAPVRHAGPPLQTVQVLAACLMAVCLVGIVAVSVAPGFAALTLEIHGARFTSQSIVASIVGFEGAPNLFGLRTDRAAERLAALPAVESASVRVRLPSTIVVTLTEREPRLVWAIGSTRYAVDSQGLLFGLVDTAGNPIPSAAGPLTSAEPGASPSDAGSGGPSGAAGLASIEVTAKPAATPNRTATPKATPAKTVKASAGPSARPAASLTAAEASLLPSLAPLPTTDPGAVAGPQVLGLPVVFDRRTADARLTLGDLVDPVNLDAGFRLANLTPADIGTSSKALIVSVDDTHGFTISSVPAGWVAEFGFYATTIRSVSVIPEQVRDLRSLLLAYGDGHVAWVWLVADVSSSHVNTYLPR
jgi:hypothetical protein